MAVAVLAGTRGSRDRCVAGPSTPATLTGISPNALILGCDGAEAPAASPAPMPEDAILKRRMAEAARRTNGTERWLQGQSSCPGSHSVGQVADLGEQRD